MNFFTRGALLLTAAAMASYIEPPFPGPTNDQEIFEYMIQGVMPAPTQAPVLRFDWSKRQALTTSGLSSAEDESSGSASGGSANSTSAEQIGWLAPDNTCGYIGGSIGAVQYCAATQLCGAATIGSEAKLACCGTTASAQCTFFQTCIDYAAFYSSSACDHACLLDVNTIKCVSSQFPHCYPYSVPGLNALYYACDAYSTDVPQPFLTTYLGEDDGRSWIPVYNTSIDTGSGLTNTVPLTQTSNTESVTNTRNGPGSTTETGAALGGSTVTKTESVSPSQTSAPAEKKSSTPIGAIVGGVVGGVAAIGIAAGAIVFFCLRSRKRRQQDAAPAAVPAGAQQPAMAAAPGQQAYAPPAQYDYKHADVVQSPVPPRYSHVEADTPGNVAELSGDYHQPVINPQGQHAHELGPGQSSKP